MCTERIRDRMEYETGFEIEKQENGMYEWGFDLTNFKESEDEYKRSEGEGVKKFKGLLEKFGMSYKGYTESEVGYEWSDREESIVMVTGNNPITGEYWDTKRRETEKGYLSYVGISCKSREVLQEFIIEFRRRATFIKEESNGRIYI